MRYIGEAALGLLALFVTFFVVLALDIAWRIWGARAGFDGTADVVLLLTLEAVRALVTVSFVVIAITAARRREPGHTAFAFALLFFALWYVKFVSFAGYPGHLQQWLATRLNELSTPPSVLRFLFGQPLWALAPAMAAFLAFATRYPSTPRAELVRSVHAAGRRGMMRSVAFAGADVRSVAHRAAARAVDARVIGPSSLALFASGGAAALAFGSGALRMTVLVSLGAVFAFAVVFLRTALLTEQGPHVRRLRRLGLAGASLALELIACGALAFVPGGGIGRITLALAAAAPLGALYFLIAFVRPDSSEHVSLARALPVVEGAPA